MTPEKLLIQFLKYWMKGNKKQMHARTSKTWQSRFDKNAFQAIGLTSFDIVSKKVDTTVADFIIKLNGELHSVRLLKEDREYNGSADGEWGVFPGSFRAVTNTIKK